MDLDHHAAEAAALLRDEVDAEVDLDTAYGRVLAGVGRRRARAAGVRMGVAALVALVAVAGLAIVITAGAGPGDDGRARGLNGPYEVGSQDDLTAQGAAILGGLPDGPLDGRESWRLPVVADPAFDLSEGDQVTLYGKGFQPGELVGAVHCSSEADTASAGVGACDLGTPESTFANTVSGNARFDGSVVIVVPVRRFITTPELGPVDCASAAERCLLAIGAAEDYDRSGGTYIDFADAPPFPEATSAIDPPGPYTAGQEVTIQGSGLVPGRQYQVEQCAGTEHCASLSMGRASAEGVYAATVAIGAAVEVDGAVRECGDDCTLQVRGVGLPEQTTAEPPPAIPLGPIAGEGAVASAPTTTAPPDPATAESPDPVPTTELPPSTEPLDPGPTTIPASSTTPATTGSTTTTTTAPG
jgi:hypothetical protein